MPTSLAVKPSTSGRTTIEFPLVRNFFADMETLTNRIAQHAFSLFQERGSVNGRDWEDWFRAESDLLKPVPIEMSETDDSYTVRAEVPGFDVKDITVQAEPNSI